LEKVMGNCRIRLPLFVFYSKTYGTPDRPNTTGPETKARFPRTAMPSG
jgi:hypothetical protein